MLGKLVQNHSQRTGIVSLHETIERLRLTHMCLWGSVCIILLCVHSYKCSTIKIQNILSPHRSPGCPPQPVTKAPCFPSPFIFCSNAPTNANHFCYDISNLKCHIGINNYYIKIPLGYFQFSIIIFLWYIWAVPGISYTFFTLLNDITWYGWTTFYLTCGRKSWFFSLLSYHK